MNDTIGYSCKNNDQGNKPFPVTTDQLTPAQLTIMKARMSLDAYKAAFEEAQAKFQPTLDTCKHTVFWDRDDGFMYHHRHCVLCGASMGVI